MVALAAAPGRSSGMILVPQAPRLPGREHVEPAQAGKTSVLYCLQDAVAEGPPASRPAPQPTVGLNLGGVDLGGVPVTLWDVGGATTLRRLWPDYYAEAQGVAFVVDAGDQGRWAEAAHALQAALGARAGFRDRVSGLPGWFMGSAACAGDCLTACPWTTFLVLSCRWCLWGGREREGIWDVHRGDCKEAGDLPGISSLPSQRSCECTCGAATGHPVDGTAPS